MIIPFSLPSISEAEIKAVTDVLRSGWLTTGEKTKEFEAKFAQYVSAKYAVAVSSCTAGLFLALKACGIKEGDEVLLPTWTFCATGNVCIHLGALPVLCDVDDDFNISIDEIEKKRTKRTKAIIPVHFAGLPCSLDKISFLAQASTKERLVVIEDAAHACGSEFMGEKIGHISDATVFSFYPTKNITTGEGGMVTTDSAEIYQKVSVLTRHGISKNAYERYRHLGDWYYEVVEGGYKYNLTDIQSALGLVQLSRVEEFIARRTEIAHRYTEAFKNLNEIIPPPGPKAKDRHSWHLYVIRLVRERLKISRNQFIEELKKRKIGTSVHFIPLHFHPYYAQKFGYRKGDFPRAEKFYEEIISLPLYPKMTDEEVDYIISAIYEIVEKERK